MFCVKCGTELSKGAKFCRRCGNEARQRSVANKSESNRTKTVLIIVAIVIALSGLGFAFFNGALFPSGQPNHGVTGSFTDTASLRDEPEVFHYIYLSDVIVIEQPPMYSFIELYDTFIITVYNPNDEIRQLVIGDTFVFVPTNLNPEGIAGHIIDITVQGSSIVITVRIPESLEEIFYEFHFAGAFDLLELADEIILGDDLVGVEGIELVRNRTSRVSINAINANIAGITVNGTLTLYRPYIAEIDLTQNRVESLVLRTGVVINLTADAQVHFDRVFTLFTIPLMKFGTGINVDFGLRFAVDGSFHLEVTYDVQGEFGFRRGGYVDGITTNFTYNFEFYAMASIAANLQARARVLSIPVYGIEANIGRGVHTNTAMQARCPEDCFVVEFFNVRVINSLDWGVLGRVQAFRFFEDLARNEPQTFRYRLGGNWSDVCFHGGAQVAIPSNGERVYLEYDIFSVDATVRTHPRDGHRTMGGVTYHRGISSIWAGLGGGGISYDISGQGFTQLTGVFGRIDSDLDDLDGSLTIFADGIQIFTYSMFRDFDTPRQIDVSIPPNTQTVEIHLFAMHRWTWGSEYGFMDAFFTR